MLGGAAALGVASAGIHRYKNSEHAQPWGEYKVFGQRPKKPVKPSADQRAKWKRLEKTSYTMPEKQPVSDKEINELLASYRKK